MILMKRNSLFIDLDARIYIKINYGGDGSEFLIYYFEKELYLQKFTICKFLYNRIHLMNI